MQILKYINLTYGEALNLQKNEEKLGRFFNVYQHVSVNNGPPRFYVLPVTYLGYYKESGCRLIKLKRVK
jgi:hypothetical protein